MKKVIVYALMLCCALFLVQCKSKKKAVKEEATTAVAGEKEPTDSPKTAKSTELQPIKVFANYVQEPSDPFTLLGMRSNGDTLFVEVQYGGGCEEHEFSMHTTGAWMKSNPPQLMLYLDHKANNDMCRALITKEVAFDLSKTKYPGSKQMKLIVNDNREKALLISY